MSHIQPFSCNPCRNKEPKCEWTCFSTEAKWCLLTFRNAWDAGASLEAELVAARAQEGSDEKASESISPDYRMMRDGWKVRQRKQLGPPRPATAAAAAALSLKRGAADNVGTSEPFMFRLKVPVRAGQAPTCRLLPSPHFNHIGIYILTLLHGCCGIRSQIPVKFSLLVSPNGLYDTHELKSPPKSSHKLKRKSCCYSALLFFISRVVVMVQVRL